MRYRWSRQSVRTQTIPLYSTFLQHLNQHLNQHLQLSLSPPDSPQRPFGGFGTPSHIPSFNSLWGHSWFLLGSNGSPTELGPSPCFHQTFEALTHTHTHTLMPCLSGGGRGVFGLVPAQKKKTPLLVSIPSRCTWSITLTTKMRALWPAAFVPSTLWSDWHLKKGGNPLWEC